MNFSHALPTLSMVLVFALGAHGQLQLFEEEPLIRESLGATVTLNFEIEGGNTGFTVSTARRNYALSSVGTLTTENLKETGERDGTSAQSETPRPDEVESKQEHEEHNVEFKGEIAIAPGTEEIFVTCEGSYQASVVSEEVRGSELKSTADQIRCKINASALMTPGKQKVLARSGKHVLVLTVEVEE
jgi:hypothetical protein